MSATQRVFCLVMCSVLWLLPPSMAAQVLRGVVVESVTRSPLPAVLVTLVDRSGRDRQRFLVDSTGTFRFLVPEPGQYSVRVERLGADTNTLEGIHLQAGETVTVRVPMEVRPIALAGIEVGVDQRCELSRDVGGQTQRVWEEVRKVLAVASLTDSLTWYRYDLVKYRRDLDPESLVIREEIESRRISSSRRPIESRPIDLLVDSGFVVQDRAGDRYYAPDADVLLSDEFLGTHCFALRAGLGEETGLIGLEFRPLRKASRLADIEGVLWLEPRSGALKWLEFRYTRLPGVADEIWSDKIGGRVQFHGLPDGTWIVSKWFIRMPVVVEVREPLIQQRRVRIVGIVEEGGRVVRARRQGTDKIAFSERTGTIVGQVAQVREGNVVVGSMLVMGVGARASLGDQGRFRIEGLPEGHYRLAHVRPEMMGLDRTYSVAEVSVAEGEISVVNIDPTPYGDILASFCGREDWAPDTAVLVGAVIDSQSGVATTGAQVRVEWQSFREVDLNRVHVDGREVSLTTTTDRNGSFRLCGVPTLRTMRVSAELGNHRSAQYTVDIPAGQPVLSLVIDWPGNQVRDRR